MQVYGDLDNPELSRSLAVTLGAVCHFPDRKIFSDGERRIRIGENIAEKDVVFLKSLSNPTDSNILEFAFLARALSEKRAKKISAIVPYVGYARAGEEHSLQVVISILEQTLLSAIALLDPHDPAISDRFHIPVVELSAVGLLKTEIEKRFLKTQKITVVSPDTGGAKRAKHLARLLGSRAMYAILQKRRNDETGKIEILGISEGKLSETCCIIDDMIASGQTMIEASDFLRRHGVGRIDALATHAVFSEDAPHQLSKSSIEKVYVTNSIQIPKVKLFEKLEIISCADLFSATIEEWRAESGV